MSRPYPPESRPNLLQVNRIFTHSIKARPKHHLAANYQGQGHKFGQILSECGHAANQSKGDKTNNNIQANDLTVRTPYTQGLGHSIKVSKGAKIMNRCNQVPHLTQDTNGKVTNAQLDTTNESQEVSPFRAMATKHI